MRVDHGGLPLSGADALELDRFRAGDALFESTFREADGLGPLYVRSSCSACHAGDGRGPGRVGKLFVEASSGSSVTLPFGTSERPYFTAGARLPVLAATSGAGVRVHYVLPPALFGRGYLDAIRDDVIRELALRAERRTGPIRGRLHRVRADGDEAARVGRFGLRAQQASLSEFVADALLGDMGLTSATRPEELPGPEARLDDDKPGVDVDSEVVAALSDYVRLIEIPRRAADAPGRRWFEQALCADCHIPELETRAQYPIRALAGIRAPVYTDLLLHDMGSALADGAGEGDASGSEWRTAPLIGLRFASAYLHDGRATNVEQAILEHGGPGSEATGSVERFRALAPSARAELVAFVEGL